MLSVIKTIIQSSWIHKELLLYGFLSQVHAVGSCPNEAWAEGLGEVFIATVKWE